MDKYFVVPQLTIIPQTRRLGKPSKVDLSDYLGYTDAHRQLGRFLDEVYVHKRIHIVDHARPFYPLYLDVHAIRAGYCFVLDGNPSQVVL